MSVFLKKPALHHLEPTWSWSVEKQECSPRLVNCNQFHIVFRHKSLQITAVLICNSIHMSTRNTAHVDFPLYFLSQTMLFYTAHWARSQNRPRDAILRSLPQPCPFKLFSRLKMFFKGSRSRQHCVSFYYSEHVLPQTGGLFLLWQAFHLSQECALDAALRPLLSKSFPLLFTGRPLSASASPM